MAAEGFARGKFDGVPMKNGVEAVAGLGAGADEAVAMGDQTAQIANGGRGNPDC